MKKLLMSIILFGVLSTMMINCNEKSNPAGPYANNQDSTRIDSVMVKVIVNDTVQIGIDHKWEVIINKPELVDLITLTDSGEGNIVTGITINKNQIKDTILWTSSNTYEETVKARLKWTVGNQSRDTLIKMYVLDTIPVDIQQGSFGSQTLIEGDSLYLFIKTNPFTSVPYTCQWYKDGQKIGDSVTTEFATIVDYNKSSITMADSGTYSIDINRPHSHITYGGMHVLVTAKQ